MKKHKQFFIVTRPINVDIVSGLMWQFDIEGINETDTGLFVFTKEESGVNKEILDEALDKLVKENLLESYTIEETEIEEINWNEEWEKNTNVVKASGRITIKPTFKDYTPGRDDEIIITIDPKMSFGTGEHETTKLMLNKMESIDLQNKKVLDIGSGTAVLSIAAAKLGAAKVIAVDNDEWCLTNGIENVNLNSENETVTVKQGELKDIAESDFDIILANINKHILIELAPDISKKIKDGGILLLSGLLYTDEADIKETYKKEGFRFIDILRMNEWIALQFYK